MKTVFKLLALTTLSLSAGVNAALFDVEYHNIDGSQWTGVVDSSTDKLTLTSWVEGAGGQSWWTPVDPTSLVFTAVNSSYGSYDVLDSWDGTIGSNWGFLSDLGKDSIAWNEGVFTGNSSRFGWGIGESNNGSLSANYDETRLLWSPNSSTGNSWQILSGDDFVSVNAREGTVPTPASLFLISLGLIGIMATRRRKY